MRKIVVILFMQLLSLTVFGQHTIQGSILDAQTKEAIAYADVVLFKATNQVVISSVYSNDMGAFTLAIDEEPTAYYIEVIAFGYERQVVDIKDLNILTIRLNPDQAQLLDEVKIVANKKAIALKGDKLIYDVEQMGISTAANGLETMQQLPGITLDKDENIKFRGSTGIQIMINGKKSMLQGDALREYIRSLKGEDIQSVEIISQPSARYEASGTTGILNIVLKKNTSKAWGGTLYVNGGYGEYYKVTPGGRFYYNDDKWSINASGSQYKGESFNDRAVDQTIQLEEGQRELSQKNYWHPKNTISSFSMGIERKLNKNHLLSTSWQGYIEREIAVNNGTTMDYLNETLQDEVALTQKYKKPVDQISGNLFYNFTSDSLLTKVDVQLNYGTYKTSKSGYQQNENTRGEIDRLDRQNSTNYDLMNAQVDWNQKIAKNFSFETGMKFSYIEMNYANQYDVVQGQNLIIPPDFRINDFRFKEKLTSAYAQFNYNLDNWNFLGGLRMENYHYEATSLISQETNKNQNTNWFPSASVSYEQDLHQYRLSYSKRISRPDYLALNPYFEYLDAYSVQRGNPNLKPQMYHSFELNYIYKNSISLGFYGYLYRDGFVNVVGYQQTENYNILYNSNASTGSRYGFNASMPYQAATWWSMQFVLDAYLTSETSKIENYAYKGNGYGVEFNTYQRFTLPQNWTITWNGFLTGRNKTETGYTPVIYDFSTAVKKTFFDDKLQVTAGCTNILKKSMWNQYSTVGNVNTHWVNKWETRRFYLQVSYNFGGNKEKKVKNTTLNDEENRM